jgi:hypothetical protein
VQLESSLSHLHEHLSTSKMGNAAFSILHVSEAAVRLPSAFTNLVHSHPHCDALKFGSALPAVQSL